ncbi:MAG: tetratricopeptide repeat protein [Blastocatellia bacterium]
MNRWTWTILLLACLGASVFLQHRLDQGRDPTAEPETSLYLKSGKTLRRMSLGYHGLLADVYWLRTIQYFGGKLRLMKEGQELGEIIARHMDLLEPMLTITTELDPGYQAAWRFGAIFLPDYSRESAIRFVKRGIEARPADWRMYQDLAWIYWKGKQFDEAGEIYEKASQIAGAPSWLKAMPAIMKLKGGDRETARGMFLRMYQENDDPYIKGYSLTRLKSFQADDELAIMNRLLISDGVKNQTCPDSLSVIFRGLTPAALEKLRQAGMRFSDSLIPADPDGFAYELDPVACVARLSTRSTIQKWKD